MTEINFDKYTKNIQAFIRILPNDDLCWDNIKICDDKKTVYARYAQDFGKGKTNVIPNYWTYETDGILYNLDQNNIYQNVISNSLEKAILGVNLLIFAYGQTGTGKSTTINGFLNAFKDRGFSSRILTDLFRLKKEHNQKSKIKYKVSFVEINKVGVFDLLQKQRGTKLHNPYKNLQILKIKSEYEAFKYLFQGEENRNIYYNSGYYSNYYTSVFTIHVQNCSRLISNPVKRISKIHIIDMAGIDTYGNSSCHGKNTQEIGIANLNKTQLEYCLLLLQKCLTTNQKLIKDAGTLVDYLGDSLKPESLIKFIGHIRTRFEDLHVTVSVLKFANIARNIKSAKLKPLIEQSNELLIEHLKQELDYVKKQNYLTAMLKNDELANNITESRIEQMENAVDEYLTNKSNEINLLNITDINTVLKIFKNKVTDLELERNELLKKTQPQMKSISKLSANIGSTHKGSKSSGETLQRFKEKGSKTSRSSKKRRSTRGSKRRKSSIKSVSKQSFELKSNLTGSGTVLSLSQLMSYHYQGNVTQSLKPKLQPVKSEELISTEQLDTNLSELNLRTDLGDDFETVWSSYRSDENYHFFDMNQSLQLLIDNSRELLKEYNVNLKMLEHIGNRIDSKKNDLLKIRMFKETKDLKCESNDTIKIIEIEQKLGNEILELTHETIRIKELLLTLQTDLKINIDDYHRLKKNINEDFRTFCIDTSRIQMAITQQITECIEDKILLPEIKSPTPTQEEIEELKRKSVFDKLQLKLRKKQELNLKRK